MQEERRLKGERVDEGLAEPRADQNLQLGRESGGIERFRIRGLPPGGVETGGEGGRGRVASLCLSDALTTGEQREPLDNELRESREGQGERVVGGRDICEIG